MWNNQPQSYGEPPQFPIHSHGPPSFPSPQPGYQSSYSPSYGPPPGPPVQYGGPAGGYGPPPGPPPSGYGPPPGPPPSAYPPPPGPPPTSNYFPPPGPPTQRHGPPVPPGGYAPPPGPPPPRIQPGEQYHSYQNTPMGGYPGQQHHANNYNAPPPNSYNPPGRPPMPPSQVQHYGPHFTGADNRDMQAFFQYSQCTGKKKGLFIGINYVGQDGQLSGCINDVHNIQKFLIERYGYKREDMVTLTDDQQNPRGRPTRENMIHAMQWLVRGARPNDSLFFHFSGHGGQTKDLEGDEADGYDEVIYPVDFAQAGHITDDDLHDLLVKPVPSGCRLTSIMDCCHSGSGLDLPYMYSTEGKLKEPNLAAEAGQGLLQAVSSYAKGDLGGVFRSAMGIVKTATGNSQKADKISKATKTSPADCIGFSGCKDDQTSADTQEAGQATGAMSYAFIAALTANPQQSYQQLLMNVRDILKTKYSQKPQLSSSHPIDTNIMFIC